MEFYKTNTRDKVKKILREEIEKAKNFQSPLKSFILAITCKRDVEIQKTAQLISKEHKSKKLFSVEVHSWGEIEELLRKHSEVYEKHYPDLSIKKISTLYYSRYNQLCSTRKPSSRIQ